MELDKIRKYLKQETAVFTIEPHFDLEQVQCAITDFYYQLGRSGMLEDILKWEQGLKEREFQIRKKKGTL